MISTVPACLARFFDPEGALMLGRVEGTSLQPVRGDLFAAHRPVGALLPLAAVTLLSPVRPSSIVVVHPCGGLRLKPATAVIGPGAPVRMPEGVRSVEAHSCRAAVIGRTLPMGTACRLEHVLGETAMCDVVAPERAVLLDGGGYDSFCPLGPWIRCGADDALRAAVTQASAILTLYPGDVVAVRTGTVSVVSAGDQIRTEITGVGVLNNPVMNGASDE